MTNILKPSMPDTSAQEASMKRQEKLLDQQEKRVEAEEAEERRRLAATMRARRTGGMRSLLSPMRSTPQMGLSGVNYE